MSKYERYNIYYIGVHCISLTELYEATLSKKDYRPNSYEIIPKYSTYLSTVTSIGCNSKESFFTFSSQNDIKHFLFKFGAFVTFYLLV